jgi:transposase
MTNKSTPDAKAVRLDDLPLLFAIMERLQINTILDQHLSRHLNWAGELSIGQVVVGWLVYVLSQSDHRLTRVEDWIGKRLDVYSAACGKSVRALDFSDDRLADILDKLSDPALWTKFETQLNQHLIRVYDLNPQQVRLDPSTISTYAPVNEQGLLQLGHSKDGRPGDAQLKFQLGMLDPLALPLVTQVVGGKSADDPLYAPAIRQIQNSIGTGGKTYIGDSKMSAIGTRAFLVASGDYYLCPLGEKQLPPAEREKLIQAAVEGRVELRPIRRERIDLTSNQPTEIEEIAEGFEIHVPVATSLDLTNIQWQERRLIIRSISSARVEARNLDARLTRADADLEELTIRKQGKRRLSKEQIDQAIAKILERYRVEGLIKTCVTIAINEQDVRAYKNRGAETRAEAEIVLTIQRDEESIRNLKERMGWRFYATNHPTLELNETVLAYREQYRIEDGISRLKGRPLGLSPMFLQSESRMIGLINFLTIALRVLTLIEFQVRQGLKAEGQSLKGIYAGQKGRQSMRPSTELLLDGFKEINAVVGKVKGEFFVLLDPLSEAQKRILRLLRLDDDLYLNFLSYFQKPAPG